jgi:hypothetical protein
MTMEGGELPPVDWAALAPHIEHPTREAIAEALRWIGPMSASDLKGVIGDPEFHLAYLAYHLRVMVREEVLAEVGGRPAGASVETLYYFRLRAGESE